MYEQAINESLVLGYFSSFMIGLFAIIIGIAFFAFMFRLMEGSKTYRHRKALTNLYVAGKIRQYADKDNVDLKKEYKEYIKLFSNAKSKDLDDQIEAKMIKSINKDAEDKEDKKGKE